MKVTKEMQAYANEQMINLLRNISKQPIQCYSQKVKGQEKQYFLGIKYVEDIIEQIRKST